MPSKKSIAKKQLEEAQAKKVEKTTKKAKVKKDAKKESKSALEVYKSFIAEGYKILQSIEKPKDVHGNVEQLIEIFSALNDAPTQKFETLWGSLARAITRGRAEIAEMDLSVPKKQEILDRLDSEIEIKRKEYGKQNAKLAQEIASFEETYDERNKSLAEREKAILASEKRVSKMLDQAKGSELTQKLECKKAEDFYANAKKEKELAKHQAESVQRQLSSLAAKEKELDVKMGRFKEWEKKIQSQIEFNKKESERIQKEKQEIIKQRGSIDGHLQKKREEVSRLGVESIKIQNERRDLYGERKRLEQEKHQSGKVKAEVIAYARNLEKRYGTVGVVDFVKEKGDIIRKAALTEQAAAAVVGLGAILKKYGANDLEIDMAVMQGADKEFAEKLRASMR